MVDPCGQAGGKYRQTPVGGDSVFATVSLDGQTYQMGDLGSLVLPPSKDVVNWTVGSTPRVAWGMRFNHGGGYQYRSEHAWKGPFLPGCAPWKRCPAQSRTFRRCL